MNAVISRDAVATHGNQTEFTFLTSPEIWRDATLLREWELLISGAGNLNSMYQSPQWLAFLYETGQVNLASVAVSRDETGSLLGIVPLCAHQGSLRYDVAGYRLYTLHLRQVDLLGGELLLPPDKDIYDRFFLALDDAFPDSECIFLNSLPCSSFIWRYLQESEAIRNSYLPQIIEGVGDYHTLPLPPTFRRYLAQLNRKKRYNLNRQLRVLRNRCDDEIKLVRIQSRADIDIWMEARNVIHQSQRHITGCRTPTNGDANSYLRMSDLADRGLLRSYILKSDGQYFGCISGCHYRDTYYVWDITHNKHFAKLSPGTCTLYLAIEDLLGYRPVKMMNLGFGAPRHIFSTQMVAQHASVALFRKTRRNRLYRASHAAFRSCVELLKRVKHGIGT